MMRLLTVLVFAMLLPCALARAQNIEPLQGGDGQPVLAKNIKTMMLMHRALDGPPDAKVDALTREVRRQARVALREQMGVDGDYICSQGTQVLPVYRQLGADATPEERATLAEILEVGEVVSGDERVGALLEVLAAPRHDYTTPKGDAYLSGFVIKLFPYADHAATIIPAILRDGLAQWPLAWQTHIKAADSLNLLLRGVSGPQRMAFIKQLVAMRAVLDLRYKAPFKVLDRYEGTICAYAPEVTDMYGWRYTVHATVDGVKQKPTVVVCRGGSR